MMFRFILGSVLLAFVVLSGARTHAQEQGAPVITPAPMIVDQPPPAAAKNVRLEVVVTAGAGAQPRILHQATLLVRSDTVNMLAVNRQVLVLNNYQANGLRLARVVPRVVGMAIDIECKLSFDIGPPETPSTDSIPKAFPPTIEQTVTARLESGKRTTVLSTQAPGVDGPVAVHMTATVLNP